MSTDIPEVVLPGGRSAVEVPAHRPQSIRPTRTLFDLFLVSFLILFFELVCIRWFAAYVPFLAFFTNLVLTASFVGMCIGCLAARRSGLFLRHLPWVWACSCGLALAGCLLCRLLDIFWVQVGNPAGFERVVFAAEAASRQDRPVSLPIELVGAAFFLLIVLMFVGLGQVLGRMLNQATSRIRAYTFNIAGSLVGIVTFALISMLSLPPAVWFAIFAAGVGYFLGRFRLLSKPRLAWLASTAAVAGLAGSWRGLDHEFYWSGYYSIDYQPSRAAIIVNGLAHQEMYQLARSPVYSLPYWIARDSDHPPLEDVLIIGAGSGNDLAHALVQGAGHVDAVEIDPVIAELGRRNHPHRPYDDPRVHLHVGDGRAFLHHTDRKYDLIVYALVDSLTLHSAYSSIRLESFLFTRQAFAGVRGALKDDGLFVIYNIFREGWVVARIHQLLAETFAGRPVLFTVPASTELRDTDRAPNFAVLLAGNTENIHRRFDRFGSFALYHGAVGPYTHSGFDVPPEARPEVFKRITRTKPVLSAPPLLPTDDWPFLYLKEPRIPRHNLIGLGLMAGLSLAVLLAFAPQRSLRLSPHFLFLGAGFMLIETKGVTRMAVLFGSTWVVSSIVFSAILVMILLSNLYVLRLRPERMTPHYLCLFLGLLLNSLIPLDWFLDDNTFWRVVKSSALLFGPIFFAGIIFASSFRDSKNPNLDFGANIAGVVLGGAFEYLSLVFGFGLLPLIAMVLYLLSWLGLKRPPTPRLVATPLAPSLGRT